MPQKCFLCSSYEHNAADCPRVAAQHQQLREQQRQDNEKFLSQLTATNSSQPPPLLADIERDKDPRFIVRGGLQFVAPYYFTFTVPVKGRWVGKSLQEAFHEEFPHYPQQYYESACRSGRLRVMWDNFHARSLEKKQKELTERRRQREEHTNNGNNDDDDAGDNVAVAAAETAVAVKTITTSTNPYLELGMLILHTVHRHELPVLASVDPVEIVDFIHVPSATATAAAANSSTALRGVIAVNKPASIPVHSCGRYAANTVQNMLRCGKFRLSSYNALQEKLARITSTPASEIHNLLCQTVFGCDGGGDQGGLHSCHRLDKGTSGVLLFATCSEVANLVFNALTDKSTEELQDDDDQDENSNAQLAQPPWVQDADMRSMRKVYVARVSGVLRPPPDAVCVTKPNTNEQWFLLRRSIFCASAKDAIFGCLSAEQEAAAVAFRRKKRQEEKALLLQRQQEAAVAAASASNSDIHNQQQQQLSKREEKRRRQAEVTRGSNARGAFAQAADDEAREGVAVEVAKWAATWFRVVSVDAAANESVVECHPLTGRTHQLRIHLAALGCPILGDDLYGYKVQQQATNAPSHPARCSTVHEANAWRAAAWTADLARLGGGSSTTLNTTPLIPGVDFGLDTCCFECSQEQRQHFIDGSPLLALHAHRYRVSLPTVGVSVEVAAPLPAWAT